MILTCPACHTRYRVDDAAIGSAGRNLRCANCGHAWRYSPEAASETGIGPSAAGAALPAPEPPVAVPPPAPRVEPPIVEPPRVEPSGEAAAPLPAPVVTPRPMPIGEPPSAPRRHIGAGLALAAIVLVIAALVLVAVLARDRVMTIWPGTSRVYALVGFEREKPWAGLVAEVTAERSGDSITVKGDINNNTEKPKTLPNLRLILRDANKDEVASKIIDPPAERLLPGKTVPFTTTFKNPSKPVSNVDVSFTDNPASQ